MPGKEASLTAFLADQTASIRVRLTKADGSTPREAGAEMLVGPTRIWGTIGGGQLEYRCIDAARAMLQSGAGSELMSLPLGPEIGQCCGGQAHVSLNRIDANEADEMVSRAKRDDAGRPHVYVLGAGHVGRALARQLQHLPVRCILIDQRDTELALNTADVETRLVALAEAEITHARAASAFVVLTHDHALDFLLVAAALERKDAAYVGMIGSRTKRAKFQSWAKTDAGIHDTSPLVCPIGALGSDDKRPEVIASCVAAEVMVALTTPPPRD